MNEWVELARSLGERKFITEHSGFFLLSTEDGSELEGIFQTQPVETQRDRRKMQRRSFEIRPVARARWAEGDVPITVGRARTCDLVFKHPSVSKLHAHLFRKGTQLELLDLESRNGTALNNAVVSPNQRLSVSSQDRIVFGAVGTMVLDARDLYDFLAKMP